MEWYPGMAAMLGGKATVGRGHQGAREVMRDVYEVAEFQLEFSEIRDLDDRIVAIGRIRARGRESGAEAEAPWAYVIEFKKGKATLVRTYLAPKEALEAARLPL